MRTRLQKQITVDAAWFLGVLVLGGLALGGTVKKLRTQRSAVEAQRSQLSLKETQLTDEMSAHERVEDLAVASERLGEAEAMVADEARRISLISSIAQASNMRLVSLRSGTARPTADEAVQAKRHELSAVGEYRDLAGFIDALQSAEGAVAIDTVQVTPFKVAPEPGPRKRNRNSAPKTPDLGKGTESGGHRLRISLEILWLGVSDGFDALQEAE